MRFLRPFVSLCLFLLVAPLCAQVKTGIDVLEENGFDIFSHKRVGLLTNPTGVDAQMRSTVDVLYQNVNLTTLYAPEHGVRGDQYAGTTVDNSTDQHTGLPVYALYGATRKPTADMLKNVDVIVYDIQDVGCRSYTFISSMGLLMEAAAENDKEVVILDRPNPLGGEKVEGPLVQDGFFSFVSQYSIPYLYGLTCGELATMINAERAADKKCRLTVVKMDGWHRSMSFAQTGLAWVPTSPQIPTCETAFYYPLSGICGELGSINIGVGYTLPFKVFATAYADADKLSKAMNQLKLPGLLFRPIVFKPFFGASQGKVMQGVQVFVTDFQAANLTEVQFYALQEVHRLYPSQPLFNLKSYNMFDKVCGSDKVRTLFGKNFLFEDLRTYWRKDAAAFKQKSRAYYLYD